MAENNSDSNEEITQSQVESTDTNEETTEASVDPTDLVLDDLLDLDLVELLNDSLDGLLVSSG